MTVPINLAFLPSWWHRNYGISARIEEMISKGRPLEKLSIWIPDVEYGTPYENIVSIFERVDCISEM